jgi:hypothetical protein
MGNRSPSKGYPKVLKAVISAESAAALVSARSYAANSCRCRLREMVHTGRARIELIVLGSQGLAKSVPELREN